MKQIGVEPEVARERRRLGRNGPEVLAIGLGCMSLSGTYGTSDDVQAIPFLERAIELGVDFLDSSDAYGLGQNEEVLGRALAALPKGRRDGIVDQVDSERVIVRVESDQSGVLSREVGSG